MAFQEIEQSILVNLAAIIESNRRKRRDAPKGYCFPAQETLMKKLEQYQDMKVSRITLNRHLRVLEDEGYIRRIRRPPHINPDGTLCRITTIYRILARGWNRLGRLMHTLGYVLKRTVLPFSVHKKKPTPFLNDLGDRMLGQEEILGLVRGFLHDY